MARDTTPLLDLTTLVERPFIRIDGESYDLFDPGEMSPLQFHRIMLKAEELQSIDSTAAGEPELERVAKLLDDLCRLVLIAPDEVHARLKDRHRRAVLASFSVLQLATAARVRSEAEAVAPSGPTSIGES